MMTTDIAPHPTRKIDAVGTGSKSAPAISSPPPLPPAMNQASTAAIPYAALAMPAAGSIPPQPFAQQAAIFSVAAWLFCVAASVGMAMRGVRPPPAFSLVLLFGLFVGVALGIVGIMCGGKPRQTAILVPGIIGIVLNGMLLLIIVFAALGVVARAQQSSAAIQPTVYVPQTPYIPPARPFQVPSPRPFQAPLPRPFHH